MKIPQSWKDITINQYIETLPSSLKGMEPHQSVRHRLKKYCNISDEQAREMTQEDIEKIVSSLSFLRDIPKSKYKKRFRLNGQTYRVVADIRKHKADAYMFIMNVLKDMKRDPEALEKQLHLVMASVCLPVKFKIYKDGKWFKYHGVTKDIKETASEFYEDLTMDIVFPISIFFSKLSRSLTPTIQNSLTRKMKEIETIHEEIKEDLKRSTGGL